MLLLFVVVDIESPLAAPRLYDDSDLVALYDPGIPASVSVEWSFPTGFSLGIDGGYQLRIGDQGPLSSQSPSSVNLFPLSFLMKYSLYQSRWISQSVSVGLGPYFLHTGQMPIQLRDLGVTGSSTWITEWITRVSQDLYVNLNMKYTHAFQPVILEIPLWDFTTWLGLNLRW
jgi:hypothetical protein